MIKSAATMPPGSVPKNWFAEFRKERSSILSYWINFMYNDETGQFRGALDHANQPVVGAPLGTVMLARICWAFSTVALDESDSRYQLLAEKAFRQLIDVAWDEDYGGLFWSLNEDGRPLNDRKQIYGQAFGIYGLAAFYELSGETTALEKAGQLLDLIEQYARDPLYDGYFEAFTREWKTASDMRLSEKEPQDPKTANTHLHILEAYAALYRVAPGPALRKLIANLLRLFDHYFVQANGRLQLFYSRSWRPSSALRSFGHEIEAAWLLLDCANVIGDNKWVGVFEQRALRLAEAAIEAFDNDGGLWYELEPIENSLIKEKHSWPQAEALVAFGKLWQLTGNDSWLQKAEASWRFIQQNLVDPNGGEWHWGLNELGKPLLKDKAGFWKCPYHNTRALTEWLKWEGR